MIVNDKVLMRCFTTKAGYKVYVNMDNVVRVWTEPKTLLQEDGTEVENTRAGETCIMYPGGVVDHVEESLREVLYGKGA